MVQIGQIPMNQLPFSQPGRFYRGNLHTHSTNSDGGLAPRQVCDAYQRHGYDFVAVTDHFMDKYGFPITDTREQRCADFTTLLGAELHAPALENGERWHILAVGLPLDFAPPAPDETGPDIAARASDAGAFVSIAHPHWYNMTINDARSIPSALAIEVHNQTAEMYNDRADGWYLADLLLGEGRRITAIATDDAHSKHERPDMFGAWVMVKSESLDPDSLLSALKAGHFYSTQGPLIHDISVDLNAGSLSVTCSPARSIFLTGRTRNAYDHHGHGMTECQFPLDKFAGDHCRLTVVDREGKRAWSNPIWLD